MRVRLEARPEPSRLMGWLSPLFAVAATLIVGFVLFAVLGKNPFEAFRVFFLKPVESLYGVGELLLKASPLMLCAVGLAAGYCANVWNIGAEGQLTLGALCGGGVGLALQDSGSAWVLPLMLFAGAAGGMAWAAIPAWLKTRFNANEILVSLMLVYVAALALSLLVHGPWRDPEGFNFPQSKTFADVALLPNLLPETRLNVGFLLALAVVAVAWLFMRRSLVGRLHPLGILLSSLLMSLLYLGGEAAQINLALPSAVTGLFQGMLLFFLLAADVLINFRLRVAPGTPAVVSAGRGAAGKGA